MKKIIFPLLLLLSANLIAQNDIQLSHQVQNRILFNPAATGQSGCHNLSLLAREQWTGIDQAPSTQLFNYNKYFKGPKLGIGFSVINDKLGVEHNLNVKGAVAYHAWLTDRSVLSFGLGLGIIKKSVDGSKLVYETAGDPNAVLVKESKLKPDFDFGVEFNSGGLNLGVSSTHLITSIKKSDLVTVPRHLYAYGKYAIRVSDGLEIVPAVSWYNVANIHQIDINSIFYIQDRFWAGATYRLNDAFVMLAGVKIIDQLRIGYAYDFKIGPIKSSYTKGSHEIMLIGKFGCTESFKGMIAPRFFN